MFSPGAIPLTRAARSRKSRPRVPFVLAALSPFVALAVAKLCFEARGAFAVMSASSSLGGSTTPGGGLSGADSRRSGIVARAAGSPASLKSLKVPELKEKLQELGLPTTGKKDELLARLEEASGAQAAAPEPEKPKAKAKKAAAAPAPAAPAAKAKAAAPAPAAPAAKAKAVAAKPVPVKSEAAAKPAPVKSEAVAAPPPVKKASGSPVISGLAIRCCSVTCVQCIFVVARHGSHAIRDTVYFLTRTGKYIDVEEHRDVGP
ncbi:unnamed protein product [Polarella glacialis]|uniref:SAP domain-containing protein n=1 Tax=Polarella glacialis TaxID=89957 RepID=A0A813K495_POLGL|nr:unnamed protein product [Polarella glacialis]